MELIAAGISYHSSDFNAGSLVYTETDGTIHQHRSVLLTDHFRKSIKYYPPDDRVFTTTDVTGLRVWDAVQQRVIYAYKPDTLYAHAYSGTCILASFDDYNIKFYDLRCRYIIQSLKKSGIAEIGWAAERLYTYDGDVVEAYDYRSLDKMLCINGATGFAVSGACCFALQKDDEDTRLIRIADGEASSLYKKKVRYESICGVKPAGAIAGLENGRIKMEEYGRIWELRAPEKIERLDAVYFGGAGGYLFANECLYALPAEMEAAQQEERAPAHEE